LTRGALGRRTLLMPHAGDLDGWIELDVETAATTLGD